MAVEKTNKELKAQVEQRQKDFVKSLDIITKELRKKTDDEDASIGKLGDMPKAEVEKYSSGSLVLDSITEGGFPAGRIIEIYGPEASGKTSVALNAIADVQRKGGNAAFIDVEQALDPRYARILGVDTDNLAFTQASIAEEVFWVIRQLVSSGTVDIIVVDSVAALSTQEEVDNPEKQQMAILARLMSKQMRMLAPLARKNKCTIIFLNQIREKVGIVFGNPETTPGGKALKFYASQRIEVRKKGTPVREGNEIIGTEVKMKVIKNKVGAPFGEGTTVLTFAQGINRPAELLVVGEEQKVLELRGRSYYFTPEKPIEGLSDDVYVDPDNGEIKLGGSKAASIATLADEEPLYNAIVDVLAPILANSLTGEDQSPYEEQKKKGKKKSKVKTEIDELSDDDFDIQDEL